MSCEISSALEIGWFGFKKGAYDLLSPILPESLRPQELKDSLQEDTFGPLESQAKLIGSIVGIIFTALATTTLVVGSLVGVMLLNETAGIVLALALIIGIIFYAGMKCQQLSLSPLIYLLSFP